MAGFNTSQKTALTASAEGRLVLQPKSLLSWLPYFEFVPADEGGPSCFHLRTSAAKSKWVRVENDQCELSDANPARWHLIKTPKPNFFQLRSGRHYVHAGPDNSTGMTEQAASASAFCLSGTRVHRARLCVCSA